MPAQHARHLEPATLGEQDGPAAGARGESTSNGGLITADEVARLLGVPVTWVYEQSRKGTIPTVPLGRYRRYRREAIEQWVRQLEAAPRGEPAVIVR